MRIPKPFFRKQTQSWYVQLGKQQVNPGKDKPEALAKYHRLMAEREPATEDTTVEALLLRFSHWGKEHQAAATHAFYRWNLLSFAEHIGDELSIGTLKPFHVTDWVAAKLRGGDNHSLNPIRSIQRALNWAVSEGHLKASPLVRMKKPTGTPRDAVIEPGEWQAIIAALEERGPKAAALLDLLTFLRETGCRPKEARLVEARHLARTLQCQDSPPDFFAQGCDRGRSEAVRAA